MGARVFLIIILGGRKFREPLDHRMVSIVTCTPTAGRRVDGRVTAMTDSW
jgi:predicted metal-binding protein